MTKQSFKSGLATFTSNMDAYSGRMRVEYLDFPPTTESGQVYQLTIAENWQNLKILADTELTKVEVKLTKIKNHQLEINSLVDSLYLLRTGFKDYHAEPQTSIDSL